MNDVIVMQVFNARSNIRNLGILIRKCNPIEKAPHQQNARNQRIFKEKLYIIRIFHPRGDKAYPFGGII